MEFKLGPGKAGDVSHVDEALAAFFKVQFVLLLKKIVVKVGVEVF